MQQPTRAGSGEPEDEFARFRRSQGPLVLPGTYTVTVIADGERMSKPVQVQMDPRIQIDEQDLKAQLATALSMRDLSSRVNHLLYHTNDLIKQLDGLSTQLKQKMSPNLSYNAGAGDAPRDASSAAMLKQVTQTIDKLTRFRDDELTRPIPGLGYRQYPRLVEEVGSLNRMITNPVSKPTDPDMQRMGELVEETNKAESTLSAIIAQDVAAINQAMSKDPRINAGVPIL